MANTLSRALTSPAFFRARFPCSDARTRISGRIDRRGTQDKEQRTDDASRHRENAALRPGRENLHWLMRGTRVLMVSRRALSGTRLVNPR
jgi:hypothetical protein